MQYLTIPKQIERNVFVIIERIVEKAKPYMFSFVSRYCEIKR